MKELVKKLEQEQAELESKLVKLRAFVGGEDFLIPVNSVQATLLRMQLHSMELYASILEWRIANLFDSAVQPPVRENRTTENQFADADKMVGDQFRDATKMVENEQRQGL